MSKQSVAKAEQGYEAKPIHATCGNCRHFTSRIETKKGYFGDYTEEKDKRCSIGGFTIKKNGRCKLFEAKK